VKEPEKWQPSKFVRRNGRLLASRDEREVALSSRLHADLVARWYDLHIRQFVRGRLLDLGCGKIPLFEAYRRYITASVCVDWGNSLHRNAHLDMECDLTQRLPFADGEFDTIILSDVLEHIPEPGQLWHEMARVLAPHGRVLMNVPFLYWLHEEPHDYYRYTEHALQRFATAANLRVTHLTAIGGAPEVLADMLAKNIVAVAWIGRPMAVVVQSIAGALASTRLGRDLSARTARRFPLGYAVVAEKPEPHATSSS
jgi:SAM-dependent methyltransferase